MKNLSLSSEIWTLTATSQDFDEGARYASISLPWTFNRMMLNTGSYGQQIRALNIAKGIVSQEILRRALTAMGIQVQVQRKSHRSEDLFDFYIENNGEFKKLDVKSWNYFSNYEQLGREPLSTDLIIKYADYGGPDWRHFFPMLVPHTQIGQAKEAYCFVVASSIDFRRDIITNRSKSFLAAFPYGPSLPFLSSSRLCNAREEEGKGFYIVLTWYPEGMLYPPFIEIDALGEWDGEMRILSVCLTPRKSIKIGPFSCLASIKINEQHHNEWYDGNLTLSVNQNDFDSVILSSNRRNLNIMPDDPLVFKRNDFCNLILPNDYKIFVIGWITKEGFLNRCRQYNGWVWPIDSVNRYENQLWSQITDADKNMFTRNGFDDCIQSKPSRFNAGWMKTTGKGGGACCYIYPNIGRMGGVKETNLYILPQDLMIIDSLG